MVDRNLEIQTKQPTVIPMRHGHKNLIVNMSSIKIVFGLAASVDLEIEQPYVKISFLHGDLEDKIYMEHLEGLRAKGNEQLVCMLKKRL